MKKLRTRPATYNDYEPWMEEQGIPLPPDEYIIELVEEEDETPIRKTS